MRYALLLFIILFIFTCQTKKEELKGVNFEKTDLSSILAEAQKLDKKVLIDFWADG